MTAVLPVIHYLSNRQCIKQAELAFEAGANGVFLITHHGDDTALTKPIKAIQKLFPNKFVGANFLTLKPIQALQMALDTELGNLWLDSAGVSSSGVTTEGQKFYEAYCQYPKTVFCSVAFKYQAHESDPVKAAINAKRMGYIPTTSGIGTGKAPELDKIAAMSQATNGQLAIASGMTIDNVAQFVPFLSHILVATGISKDDHHFDYELLSTFIGIVKNA